MPVILGNGSKEWGGLRGEQNTNMQRTILPPYSGLGPAPILPKRKIKVANYSWLETTKEFYRWKKTDDYQRWRNTQFGKQRGLCFYCDISLVGIKTNVEHINPRSKGGKNSRRNLVLSCWKCNKDKGSKPLSSKLKREYREKHQTKALAYRDEIELALQISYQVWGCQSEFVRLLR